MTIIISYIIQILTTDVIIRWPLMDVILGISFNFFFIIIKAWSLKKIWVNLFEFKICKLQFSDKHNWIIEPSSSNKIFALLSMLCMIFYTISTEVYLIVTYLIAPSSDTMYFMQITPFTFSILSHFFYFFYMISTLAIT